MGLMKYDTNASNLESKGKCHVRRQSFMYKVQLSETLSHYYEEFGQWIGTKLHTNNTSYLQKK